MQGSRLIDSLCSCLKPISGDLQQLLQRACRTKEEGGGGAVVTNMLDLLLDVDSSNQWSMRAAQAQSSRTTHSMTAQPFSHNQQHDVDDHCTCAAFNFKTQQILQLW